MMSNLKTRVKSKLNNVHQGLYGIDTEKAVGEEEWKEEGSKVYACDFCRSKIIVESKLFEK